jgi:hypothetical protein
MSTIVPAGSIRLDDPPTGSMGGADMPRFANILSAVAVLLALTAAPAAAGGPPSLAFYVDGARYRTVGTPTDLTGTGAPTASYDVIYALGGSLANVAEAKPGDTDFNGGRWMVLAVEWHVTPVQLTSAEQVLAYEAAGKLSIAEEPVQQFVCPVIAVAPGG